MSLQPQLRCVLGATLISLSACLDDGSADEIYIGDDPAAASDDDDGAAAQDDPEFAGGDTVAVTCIVPVSHPTIQSAENDLSCTTVQVNPGVYVENVVIDRDLTIVATTWSTVTIDGGAAGRVIDNVGANVVLRGLRITGGAASSGAGIRSVGSLEVYESLISANVAQGIDPVGGGIQAEGDVLLDRTTVFGNAVRAGPGSATASGGGVYVSAGELVLTNSGTVADNSVTVNNIASCDARGGGIYAVDADVFIDGLSAVHRNTALLTGGSTFSFFAIPQSAEGGGVYISGEGNLLAVSNSRIAANQARIDNGIADGGGIYSYGVEVELGAGTTIRNNTARTQAAGNQLGNAARGGGIWHRFSDVPGQQAPFVIDQAALYGNSALSSGIVGGGAVSTTGGVGNTVTTVVDTSMYDNRALGLPAFAGAIEVNGCCSQTSTTLEIINSTLSGNLANGGAGGSRGGAVLLNTGGYLAEGRVVIVNSTLSGNVTTATGPAYGGAVNLGWTNNATNTLEIANSTIVDNAATSPMASEGGGLWGLREPYLGPINVDIRNSIVYGNTATTGPDCSTSQFTVTSGGFNIFGNTAGCSIAGATANDLVGVNPLLGALAPNGGPTLTRMISGGSPAQDAGNPAGCTDFDNLPLTTDQRGAARAVGPACDIGAVER